MIRTFQGRYVKWSRQQKAKVGMACEICGEAKDYTRELVCHHLIAIKKDGSNWELIMDPDVILVVCLFCHNLLHGLSVAPMMDGVGISPGIGAIYNYHNIQEDYTRIMNQYGLNTN